MKALSFFFPPSLLKGGLMADPSLIIMYEFHSWDREKERNRFALTFLPPGEQVSGGGVLVILSGLEPQLDGDEPRILDGRKER